MTAVWLRSGPGGADVAPLPLPYKDYAADGVPDDVEARRRLAEEGSDRPLHASSVFEMPGPLRSVRLAEAGLELPQLGPRFLTVVVQGKLEVGDGEKATTLVAGSTVFVDDVPSPPVRSGRGGAALIQVEVSDDWGPRGTETPPSAADLRPSAGNLKRIFKGSDERSYFRGFPELLPGPDQAEGSSRKIIGLWFAKLPDGFEIDWHPEIVNQCVVVLHGEMEIEAGGGEGAVERFGEGAVLLAEDRTGQGHIDRVLGDLHLMVMVIDDSELWPVTAG